MGRINFGVVLRRLRHDRDETLEQVSEATGLSVAMLSRVERGERLPSPDSVDALARHFELPIDYLMSETIANRMVNRYGAESSSRAAEHMSRESLELGLLAPEPDPGENAGAAEESGASRRSSRARLRTYGPFQEMDVLVALAPGEEARRKSRAVEEQRASASAAPPPAAPVSLTDMSPNLAYYAAAKADRSSAEQSGAEIDPVTQRVLRAAQEASDAAAFLVLREAPNLSREARLELIDQIAMLAGQAIDVLRMLASDPDSLVRAAAREALKRLTRG